MCLPESFAYREWAEQTMHEHAEKLDRGPVSSFCAEWARKGRMNVVCATPISFSGRVCNTAEHFDRTGCPAAHDRKVHPAVLVVANLAYLQAMPPVEPHEVCLQKAPGAQSRAIFEGIREAKLVIETLVDTPQEIVARHNDPMIQGTYGALTLGFIIVMGISIAGFLIYWILSRKARIPSLGVLRARGLPLRLAGKYHTRVKLDGKTVLLSPPAGKESP